MIGRIRRFVEQRMLTPRQGGEGGERGGDGASDRRAPASSDVRLAACALLLELAYADGEFSPPERQYLEGALVRQFGVDEPTAQELLELAQEERERSVDHFQFTRLIAEQYDLGQKMVLAEVMWGVILADQQLADHEAYLVRKLARLLELEPGYLAQARRAATETGD